jgi:hypothetical protein
LPTESPTRRSYAVTWREGDGPVRAGKLMLGSRGLRLEGGTARGRLSAERIFYNGLSGVATARHSEERIRGRPTLVLKRSGRPPLAIACVDGLGCLREVAERLGRALAATVPA